VADFGGVKLPLKFVWLTLHSKGLDGGWALELSTYQWVGAFCNNRFIAGASVGNNYDDDIIPFIWGSDGIRPMSHTD
jgi:hypothetical protein